MTTRTKEQREFVNQQIIKNLRYRWPKELKPYSDKAIIACYDEFYFSEISGNNDARFPEFFEFLPEYEAKVK